MNLSTLPGSYGSGQTQRLLSSLLQLGQATQQDSPAGQSEPATGAANGSPPGPPPERGARAFATDTLASLLSVQEQSQPQDPISALMQSADSDGDGSLSLDEIKAALGDKATDGLDDAVAKLDTDGDGKLSGSELTAALDSAKKTHGHHHHHGGPPSAGELASKLIGSLDADGDGSLSLSEATSGQGGGSTVASQAADGFKKLDTDGDGKLSASELAAALNAFKPQQPNATSASAAVQA